MTGKPSPALGDLYGIASELHARAMQEQAEPILQHILAQQPDHADALNLRSLICSAKDDMDEAVGLAEAAVRANPVSAKLQANLAMLLTDIGRFSDAETAYRSALSLEPAHWPALSGLGQLLLLQGRTSEGFQHYRKLKKPYDFEGAPVRFWSGEPLEGKSLLVLRAQGLGEEIHAARYYGPLLAECKELTVVCDARLTGLLAASWPGVCLISGDAVDRIGTAAAEADFTCFITDLVALRPDPGDASYLKADTKLTASLRDKYTSEHAGKRLVGISWQTASRLRPAARSIPLEHWATLLNQHGTQFFSLQYGAQRQDASPSWNTPEANLTTDPEIDARNDIGSLAAQICAMDQVISIDNSTVHLAGALGKPVWTLLMDVPYWMWGLRGKRTSWYPSMQLFRQHERGGWKPVLQAVHSALKEKKTSAPSQTASPEGFLSAIHQTFQARDYTAALALLEEFGRAHPGHEKISRWTALCLYRQDDLERALSWAKRAMREDPQNAENHRVLGIIQQGLLQFSDAELTLRKGMRLAPDRADLRSALVMQLLLQGRCEEGWELYEAVNTAFVRTRLKDGKQWCGEQLGPETLHLWALEGVGDYSLALKILPEIEARAPNLVLECDERLIPLIQRTGTRAKIVSLRNRAGGEKLDALGELQSPEFAAIRHLAPDLDIAKLRSGNLVPDRAQVEALRARYRAKFPGKKLIGLSWYSASVSQGIARSIRPAELEPLLAVSDCQFIDLQYHNPGCPMTDYHLQPGRLYRDESIDSWADLDGLAAQLAALDLTITIDNSTAQIAGAIGAPCWTLLHTLPDWRWGLEGDVCVWYPEMRLFRQKLRRDWSAPIEAMCDALTDPVSIAS